MPSASTLGWLLLLLVGGGAAYYVLAPKSSNGPGCPAAGDAAFDKTLANIRTSTTTREVAQAILASYDGLGCTEAATKVRAAMAAAGMVAPAPTPATVHKGGPSKGVLDLAPEGLLYAPSGAVAWPGLRALPPPYRARALNLVEGLDYAALPAFETAPLCPGVLTVDLARMQTVSGLPRPLWADTDDKYLGWLLSLYSDFAKRPYFPDGPIMKRVPNEHCPDVAQVAAFQDLLAVNGVGPGPWDGELAAIRGKLAEKHL